MRKDKERDEKLQKAFDAACDLVFASTEYNLSTCSCFHTKPFNTHWDETTVKEVMEDALDLKRKDLFAERVDIEKSEELRNADWSQYDKKRINFTKSLRGFR